MTPDEIDHAWRAVRFDPRVLVDEAGRWRPYSELEDFERDKIVKLIVDGDGYVVGFRCVAGKGAAMEALLGQAQAERDRALAALAMHGTEEDGG